MTVSPIIDLGATEGPLKVLESPILQQGIELFLQNGFLIVRNAFDTDFVNKLHDAFMDGYKDYFEDKVYDDALDIGHRRHMVTVTLEGAFNSSALYAPPKIFPMLEFLLSKKLILAALGTVVSLPGAEYQHLHRDYDNIYDPGFNYPGLETVIAKGAPYAITLGIPLVPVTRHTGNTRFWPGTHLSNISKKDPNLGPGVDFETGLGSCYLFDYRILHCGVANTSEIVRPLLYNIYTRPWFRDPLNYSKQEPVHVSEAEFQKIPEEYRGLFAWAMEDRP